MHSQEKHVTSKILKYFCDDKEKQLKILGILSYVAYLKVLNH